MQGIAKKSCFWRLFYSYQLDYWQSCTKGSIWSALAMTIVHDHYGKVFRDLAGCYITSCCTTVIWTMCCSKLPRDRENVLLGKGFYRSSRILIHFLWYVLVFLLRIGLLLHDCDLNHVPLPITYRQSPITLTQFTKKFKYWVTKMHNFGRMFNRSYCNISISIN